MSRLMALLILRDLRAMGVKVELRSGELSPIQVHLHFPPETSDGFVEATRAVVRPHMDEILEVLLEEEEGEDAARATEEGTGEGYEGPEGGAGGHG